MKKIVVYLLLATMVSACTSPYSSTGETLYMKAQNGPGLKVPPPLTSFYVSSFYVLPPQTQNPVVSISPR